MATVAVFVFAPPRTLGNGHEHLIQESIIQRTGLYAEMFCYICETLKLHSTIILANQ